MKGFAPTIPTPSNPKVSPNLVSSSQRISLLVSVWPSYEKLPPMVQAQPHQVTCHNGLHMLLEAGTESGFLLPRAEAKGLLQHPSTEKKGTREVLVCPNH